MKWQVNVCAILGVLLLAVLALILYIHLSFRVFGVKTELIQTFEYSDNTTINIYESSSSATTQPAIIVYKVFNEKEELLGYFEPYESLDSSFVVNHTLSLFLSNKLGRRDTFRLPMYKE